MARRPLRTGNRIAAGSPGGAELPHDRRICSSRYRTGRALLGSAVAGLARLGYTDAILWVLDTNDRARRFYALAGWKEDGASKTDGARGFDITEVRYRRTLGPGS
jgi:hypothetical protein